MIRKLLRNLILWALATDSYKHDPAALDKAAAEADRT